MKTGEVGGCIGAITCGAMQCGKTQIFDDDKHVEGKQHKETGSDYSG
jgi:hypothetical protein